MKLELVVDKIEADRVILLDQEQRVFVWPRQILPRDAHEGQMIFAVIGDSPQQLAADCQNSPKDILNEILNLEE